MKLTETIALRADSAHDSNDFVGKKFRVIDTRYGHDVSEHSVQEDAEKAARARPFSKVVSEPTPATTDMAPSRMDKLRRRRNPDIEP